MHKTIDKDEFFRCYKPVKNPFVKFGSWDGCMLETYGLELAHVQEVMKTDPDKVWTVLDCEGDLIVASGFSLVNRMGYIITEIPVSPGEMVTVEDYDDDIDDTDE